MLAGVSFVVFVYGFLIGAFLTDCWFNLQELSTIRIFPLIRHDEFEENNDTDVDDL